MRVKTVFMVLSLAVMPALLLAQRPGCSAAAASAAEDSVGKLKTWADLHAAFKQFAACDDGGIAEGWSAFVEAAMTKRWSDVAQLVDIAAASPQFRTFVLRHVDETWDAKNIDQVRGNARERCPRGAEQLCKDIAKTIDAFGKN